MIIQINDAIEYNKIYKAHIINPIEMSLIAFCHEIENAISHAKEEPANINIRRQLFCISFILGGQDIFNAIDFFNKLNYVENKLKASGYIGSFSFEISS